MLRRYGWAPSISLADGLERTYRWVFDEVKKNG
jgi:nucleoside-diphosphate-sugar epimerase